VLVQALLDAPMFATRWRWVATISLAVRRARAGRKTPAPLQRMAAEDLISVVFPDQLACAENLGGEREIPDHPLVRQVLRDCLREAMDVDGLVALLERMEAGAVSVVGRDLPQPSLLAQEILGARPYAYLDDAPLEERRTRAVAQRRWLDPESAAQFGQLDPAAIAAVRAEAWPAPENADELHDALMLLGAMSEAELERGGCAPALALLQQQRRATAWQPGADAADTRFWVAAEQLPLLASVYPQGSARPPIEVPAGCGRPGLEHGDAVRELLRGRLQAAGPVSAARLARDLCLAPAAIEAALLALEVEGFVLRGQFTPGGGELEWCERRLLARIHRYTMRSLRAEIEPVASAQFMRFLLDWQGVTRQPRPDGPASLAAVLEQLEGFEVPAIAWESDVLPARLAQYDPAWLDGLCLSGRTYWARLSGPERATAVPVRATPIALLLRAHAPWWQQLAPVSAAPPAAASGMAAAVAEYLQQHGASFFDEIQHGTRLLPSQAESALAELVAAGAVSADSFGGLRALLAPMERRRKREQRPRRSGYFGIAEAGRWSLIRRVTSPSPMPQPAPPPSAELIEALSFALLRRYGVVFRRLLVREADWLPPWHVLLRSLRRLEAQGRIRGGRFVAGVSGEQYALPEAVAALRALGRQSREPCWVSLSAADPLNLAGIVTPGARVPALAANRVLLVDGVPAATLTAGAVEWLQEFSPAEQWQARNALLRTVARPALVQAM
jgi:ATP-dependent Lhr-like helicase